MALEQVAAWPWARRISDSVACSAPHVDAALAARAEVVDPVEQVVGRRCRRRTSPAGPRGRSPRRPPRPSARPWARRFSASSGSGVGGRLDGADGRAHAALGRQPPHGGEREAAVAAGGADARDPALVGPAAQPARGDRERRGGRLQRDLLVLGPAAGRSRAPGRSARGSRPPRRARPGTRRRPAGRMPAALGPQRLDRRPRRCPAAGRRDRW